MLALLGLALPCAAQYLLPDDMIAQFGEGESWAESMFLPVAAPGDSVEVHMRFDNDTTGHVTLDWYYQKAGANAREDTQTIDVSYLPTAIARHAGRSNVFYVVGWTPRTGNVIVERWTIGQFALGTGGAQGGGGYPVSTLLIPSITREVEWISPAGTAAPIWDAACNPYGVSPSLLLLESGSVTRIWKVDLTQSTASIVYSSANTGFGSLAGHRSMSIGRHGADGLIAFTQKRRGWDHGPTVMSAPDTVFVLRDANTDGTFETTTFMAHADLYTQYPVPWDMTYSP
ncbi:MAG TPA: hypothetical protein VFY71_09165 [Planctomycetota bacterium]|nr:hypothetical protein [Planctomycetota bacterium]